MSEHPQGAWSDAQGLRWYTFEGNDYLSVTSKSKSIGMSYALHAWILRQMAEGVVGNPEAAQLLEGDAPGAAYKRVMEFATRERDAAGKRGTQAHEHIAHIAMGGKVDPLHITEEQQWFEGAYSRAAYALGIVPLYVERQVFSDRWGYAGSFDLLAFVRKYGMNMVIDLKTSKGVYVEHAIQALSYLRADFVAGYAPAGEGEEPTTLQGIDEDATQALHSAQGIGILHLGEALPDGWDFYKVKVDDRLEAAFRAQNILSRFYSTVTGIDNLIEAE